MLKKSEIFIHVEDMGPATVAVQAGHDGSLLILPHPLLKEIGLSLQRDHLHPIKWVLNVVDLSISQSPQQSIGHKLDVLTHQFTVHAHQSARQRIAHKFPFDINRVTDDPLDALLAQLLLQEGVEQAREVAVESLIPRNQLVREGQPRHQPALL